MGETVYTPHGLGEIVASQTVHGRTQHQVEGSGFKIWIDAAETREASTHEAWAPVDHEHSVNLPYNPRPQYPAIPGDTESTIQPIHKIDPDKRLHPADSITFEERSDDEGGRWPAPNPDLFAKSASWENGTSDDFYAPAAGHEYQDPMQQNGWKMTHATDDGYARWKHPSGFSIAGHDGPDGGTWQIFHAQGHPVGNPYKDPGQAQQHLHAVMGKTAGYQHNPEMGYGGGAGPSYSNGLEPDYQDAHEQWLAENPDALEGDSPYFMHNSAPTPGRSDLYRDSSIHEANPLLLAPLLAEGAGAAAGGEAAAGLGAAEAGTAGLGGSGGFGGAGSALGRGLGEEVLSDDGDEGGKKSGPDIPDANSVIDELSIQGPGWGSLVKARMMDPIHEADYHRNPLAQFAHDPDAFIERRAAAYETTLDPEMERYGQLVEADAQIREAAWKDVRQKAMRLRREGRVDVHDIGPDRIYATVKGDTGVYETMISKKGAFGGLGGGHTISNWRCSCKWGEWAFQRRYSYVGRLCSHGYATYLAMQSEHMKGKPRQQRLDRSKRKRADLLQNVPQRLVPELIVNDTDDTAEMLDVTKDERKTTGPDDILHFTAMMDQCDRTGAEYPRELVAFLERYADVVGPNDDKPQDWEIQDFSEATSDLNKIREFADRPQSQDYQNMDDRLDEVRDAVTDAREHGVDADQLVASRRVAAPPNSMESDVPDPAPPVPNVNPTPHAPAGGLSDLNRIPVTQGGTGSPEPAPNPSALPNIGGFPVPQGLPGGQPLPAPAGGTGGGMTIPGIGGGGRSLDVPGAGGGGGRGGAPGVGDVAGRGDELGKGWGGGNLPAGGSGGGTYTVKPGDTLSGIAESKGLKGPDSLVNANPGNVGGSGTNLKSDPNLIHPGDTLKLPGGSGGTNGSGWGGSSKGWSAGPAPTNTSSGGWGSTPGVGNSVTNKPVTKPASKSFEAQVLRAAGFSKRADEPAKAVESTPPAAGAAKAPSSGPSGKMAPGVKSTPGADPTQKAPDDPMSQPGAGAQHSPPGLGMGGAGMGGLGDLGGGLASGLSSALPMMTQAIPAVASGIGSAVSGLASGLGHLFGSVEDQEDWKLAAFPGERDALPHDRPFAGSGPAEPLEFHDSRSNVEDNYSDHRQDVTAQPSRSNPAAGGLDEYRTSAMTGGVKRKGRAPKAHVEPEIVRQIIPNQARQAAHMPEMDEYDPLAPRTAASFDDDPEPVHAPQQMTAGYDPVAAFQQSQEGMQLLSANNGGGGGRTDYDDFAGAANAHLQKTAGRHYSPAEQANLIHEGERGGAGNLASLDLSGTHYEAENSVGLW